MRNISSILGRHSLSALCAGALSLSVLLLGGGSGCARDGSGPEVPSGAETALELPHIVASASTESDTYVSSFNPDSNFGAATLLELRNDDRAASYPVITFTTAAIQSTLGANQLVGAKLRVFLGRAGTGVYVTSTVETHRVVPSDTWSETGLTWYGDLNTHSLWFADNVVIPFAVAPTGSATLPTVVGSYVDIDVTADVLNILAGGVNNGWGLIINQRTYVAGATYPAISSREGLYPPQLILTSADANYIPASVAPPLARDHAISLCEQSAFLYTVGPVVQWNVKANAIDCSRAAWLRGYAYDTANAALPGVDVSVVGHPEYGQTRTQADGHFDFVVNAGAPLTVSYSYSPPAGGTYITVHRVVETQANENAWLPDVVIVPRDSDPLDAGSVTFPAGGTIIWRAVQGPIIDNGLPTQHRLTLMIPPGTVATSVTADGGVGTVLTGDLHLTATDVTAIAGGRDRMSATLPPTSGYTYATEFQATEALGPGDTGLSFNQPVYSYVEDFLGAGGAGARLAVGAPVPNGSYDRYSGAWRPENDGYVIKITGSTAPGYDDLQIGASTYCTGSVSSCVLPDGTPISDAERGQLASTYGGATPTLWRLPISHFSPWDFNFPYALTSGAVFPPPVVALPDSDSPCNAAGSIIGCEDQTLGQEVPLAGTPLFLAYSSQRTHDRSDKYTVDVPVTGSLALPASLKRVEVELAIAGTRTHWCYVASGYDCTDWCAGFTGCALGALTTGLHQQFTWHGSDVFGRRPQGAQVLSVATGYLYEAEYVQPSTDAAAAVKRSFEQAGNGVVLTGNKTRRLIRAASTFRVPLGGWDETLGTTTTTQGGSGLGGWNVDIHHAYDPTAHVLYYGDGRRRGVGSIGDRIDSVVQVPSGVISPSVWSQRIGLALAPDGTFYVIDPHANVLSRVTPGRTDASGAFTPPVVSVVITAAETITGRALSQAASVAVAPDGTVYIADSNNHRIVRVTQDPVTLVYTKDVYAGSTTGTSGDVVHGTTRTSALLTYPAGVVVGPDGSLYYLDGSTGGPDHVHRISPDGTVTLVSNWAGFGHLIAIAVARDGTMYLGDDSTHSVWRVDPSAPLSPTRYAGTGSFGSGGEGGLAAATPLYRPAGLAIAPDQSLIVSERSGERVRRVSTPAGGGPAIINTIAGTGIVDSLTGGGTGDRGPALNARLADPTGVVVGGDGTVYEAEFGNVRIRSIGPMYAGVGAGQIAIASEDGREVYVFDASGKHIRTETPLVHSATTPRPHLFDFSYDPHGYLSSVATPDQQILTVARDGNGVPSTLTTSAGVVTGVSLTGGLLQQLTGPAPVSAHYTFSYVGGTYGTTLLNQYTSPNGFTASFTYDTGGGAPSSGRLLTDTDGRPAGENPGTVTLARPAGSDGPGGYTVTRTSSLGRVTSHVTTRDPLTGRIVARSVTTPAHELTTWTLAPGSTMPGTGWPTTQDATDVATVTTAAGATINAAAAGDPQWGLQTPYDSFIRIDPGGTSGLVVNVYRNRYVPAGGLDMSTIPPTIKLVDEDYFVNPSWTGSTASGPHWHVEYSLVPDPAHSNDSKITFQSPVGRTQTVYLDSRGRLAQMNASGITASDTRTYDFAGFLHTVTQTAGTTRTTTFATSNNLLSSVTTPRYGAAMTFTPDSALTHIASATDPIGYMAALGYDSNGSVNDVLPFGAASGNSYHLGWSAINKAHTYVMPSTLGQYVYTYNADRQLTQIAMPSGRTFSITYAGGDTTGRPQSQTISSAVTITPIFEAPDGGGHSSGFITNLNLSPTTFGPSLAFRRDGSLPTVTQYTYPTAGDAEWTQRHYDTHLRVSGVDLGQGTAGFPPVATATLAYSYDNDSVISGISSATWGATAGGVGVVRDPSSGLVTSVEACTSATVCTAPISGIYVEGAQGFDSFGDIASTSVNRKSGTTVLASLFSSVITRDSAGRIYTRAESLVGGATFTYRYEYDTLGRLWYVKNHATGVVLEQYSYNANSNVTMHFDGVTHDSLSITAAGDLMYYRSCDTTGCPHTGSVTNNADGQRVFFGTTTYSGPSGFRVGSGERTWRT